MSGTTRARVAGALGFLAVALGAFGAHGLRDLLQKHNTTETWQTAVFYHFAHAIVLLVLSAREPERRGPWFCFLAGIVVFSGSLYLLSVTGIQWLGAITPLGGVAFLAGWLWLIIAPHDTAKRDSQ
jgi:uncharacterized membrane protein YgdD (TMEM256/DUF423 family)